MRPFDSRLAGAAVIATLCGASACSDAAFAPAGPPSSPSPVPVDVRALLGRIRNADQVEILDSWDGLALKPSSPERYLLRREGSASTDGAVVPAPVLDAFLRLLAHAPVLSGPYMPSVDHTDDYPHLSMTIGAGQDAIVFFSDSQGPRRVPWAVQIEGKEYVVPSDAPARALDLVRAYLPRARASRHFTMGTTTVSPSRDTDDADNMKGSPKAPGKALAVRKEERK
jgi:hypothetical protein